MNRGGNSIFKAVTAPFQACFVELWFYFCRDILLIIRKTLAFWNIICIFVPELLRVRLWLQRDILWEYKRSPKSWRGITSMLTRRLSSISWLIMPNFIFWVAHVDSENPCLYLLSRPTLKVRKNCSRDLPSNRWRRSRRHILSSTWIWVVVSIIVWRIHIQF